MVGGAFVLLGGAFAVVAQAASFAATASLAPQLRYINDPAGSVYAFTVKNTGTSASIGAVQITRPSTMWTVTSCPTPPAGWTAQASSTMCRFRSASGTADDIKPGQTRVFSVKAKGALSTTDQVGTWNVVVSKSNQFDNTSLLTTAGSAGSGLTTTLYTFEVVDAVVSDGPVTAGGACPLPNKDAVLGSTKTIVVCGRNRANVALTPTAARSSLGGTYVAVKGTFATGLIHPSTVPVVLGQWNDTKVAGTYGTGYKVIAGIGSAVNRTSPLRTFTGYKASSQPPMQTNDAYDATEDTQLVKNAADGVLANDSDVENDPMTATLVDDVDHGTLALASDGSFTYTPAANYNGTDTFTYTANDPYGSSSPATVTITVAAVEDAPDAVDDTASTSEDASTDITVLANDTEVDGQTLTISSVDNGSSGSTATIVGNKIVYDPDGAFEGLNAGETDTDTFTYEITDGNGTDTATVTVTINGVNDAPEAADDPTDTDENTPVNIDVLTNDSDDEGQALTVTADTTGLTGALTETANGQFTYSPDGKFEALDDEDAPATDTFSYTVSDGNGGTDTADVPVTIAGVNDAPTADDKDVATTEDTPVPVTLTGGDVDVEAITFSIVSGPAHGSLGGIADGVVTYTPDANYNGPDSFTYRTNDGTANSAVATVTIGVGSVNDAPEAGDDTGTTAEDTALVVTAPGVLADDTDTEASALTAHLVTPPAHGTVTLDEDGSYTYTPAADYNGSDSFTYQAKDADGASSNLATVALTVTGANDAPDANDQSVGTPEDTAKTVTLTGGDVDGDTITYAIVTPPAHGSLGAVAGDEVTYTPDPNYHGPDSFTFKTNDTALDSDVATVTIDVTTVNDLPVAGDDSNSTAEDTALNVPAPGVLGNDSDIETPVTAVLVTGPSHGTLTLNADGSYLYTPAANYFGSDSFTYQAKDDHNGLSEAATVSLTVTAVNDNPVADADSASVSENSTGSAIDVLDGDTDVENQALTVTGVDTTGTTGTVTNNGTDVTYSPNGMFEYLDDTETATDTFTYTATDTQGGTDTETVTVTVNGANDAPVAANDGPFQTFTNSNIMLTTPGVLANDTDADGEALTAGNASDPANGTVTLNPDGSFSYDPDNGYNGTDTFTYDVSDGTSTDTATVTINVIPPNAAPTADATSGSGNEDGGAITVTLTGHDDDGDALTFTALTATNGLVTVPTGTSCDANTPSVCTATVTYTPGANFNGSDSFTYTVNDGTVDSAPATATVTVNPVNDEPSFTKGGDQSVNEDAGAQSVAGWATAISAGPANESAQAVSFEVTGTTNDALFSVLPAVASNGDLTYTPAVNANGVATVSVRATDNGGTANGGDATGATQTFTVTVGAVNDAPSFTKGADQNVNEDTGAQSVSLWATAISKGPADESAQTVSFTTSNDNNALFSVQPGVTPTGTLAYTSAPNAVGSATVTISLSDTGGTANGGDDTSDSQTFTITVGPVNDAPSFTTAGDQTVLEDAGAQTVNGFVTGTSAGPADESGQTVTVSVSNVGTPAMFSAAPTITNGTLTYTPAADANGSAIVTVRATDDGGTANGGADTSPSQTFRITVTAVNDAPSFTKGADQTVNEDAGVQSVSNWATSLSKGPANESAQTLSFNVTNDDNTLFTTQPAVSATGTLTYTPAANQHGTATVSVSISDNGGTANGGDDTSDTQTFTITVNPVNDAPVAAAKAYTVQANMKISLGGLLTGATDPNDVAGDAAWSPTYTVGAITAGAGCVGCTISNVDNAAGTFDFDPPAGTSGTYTVTYTVVDSGHPAPGVASAAQTITFTVNGPVIHFVDPTAGAGGTGRLSAPFNTLAAATTAMGSDTNERIFVRGGNVSGNVTLPTDGWIISEAVDPAAPGDDFDDVMGITPPAGTIARPAIDGTQRTLAGTVTVGTNSRVRGFNVTSGAANGLVASGKTGLVVNQVSVASTTGRAVDMANSSGVISLTSVSSNGASRGISLVNTNVGTGSFAVTGTGSAGSGGTITASTATGSAGVGNNDGGIYLNNTRNVSLDRMNVTSGQGSGIYGTNVTTFSLANSTISGNGSDVGKDHDGVRFDTVLGTASITNSTITGSKENNVRFRNESGTSTITVSGSTMSNNDPTIGANGMIVDTYGGAATTVTVRNNQFTNNNTDGLAIYSNSSGAMTATVDAVGGANVFNGNHIGVDVAGNGTGPSTFVIDGVNVTGCATCGFPINAYKGTDATSQPMVVTIRNSTVNNMGSDSAAGIYVHGEGAGALRGSVTNNVVRGVEQIGIWGAIGNRNNGPAATLDLNVTGNDVDLSAAGPNSAYAIFVESGTVPGDTNVTCANIKSNKAITVAGLEGIAVSNYQSGTFRMPGFPGGTDTAAEAFIVAGNTAPVSADAQSPSGSGFTGGATCNTP